MKNSRKRLMSLFLSFAMTATTIGSNMPLLANAAELDDPEADKSTLIASFDFDSEESGFSGAGAVANAVGSVELSKGATESGQAVHLANGAYLNVVDANDSSLLTGLSKATISYVRKFDKGTGNGNAGWTFYAAPSDKSLTWANDGNKEYYVGVIENGSNVTVERFMNGRGNGSVSGASNAGWEMVTIVLDEGKTSIYIDGELASETAAGKTEYDLAETLGESSILQIGKANWNSGEFFEGYIDDFKIYNVAMTESEVMTQYCDFFNLPLQPVSPDEDLPQQYDVTKDKNTTDYLFAYFTGNTVDGENIYFASSRDGLNFEELNYSKPVLTSELGEKGIRDPYIFRSRLNDKFYIIATDLSIGRNGDWTRAQKEGSQGILVYESEDLVNWSEPRLVTLTDSIQAGCTWAPECYFDDTTNEYVVFWASKVAPDYNLQRIYYSKTTDFVNFTEPEIWIDRETASTIDTTVIAGNDGYLYRISKNEGNATLKDGSSVTGSTVYMERATSLFGEWTKVKALSLESISGVEGPTSYKLNADDADEDTWVVLLDHFGGNGYAPVVTTDLGKGKFTSPAAYQLPSAPRHGTVLNITAEEYDRIQDAYGNKYDEDGDLIINELPEEIQSVCTDKLLYFFDSGVSNANEKRPRSGIYKAVSKLTNLRNEVPDQFYSANEEWGYVNDEDYTEAGNRTSENDDLYSNGWWARKNKNCEYDVMLSNGTYTATGYYAEYWSQTRSMNFYVEYTDDAGKTIKSEAKTFKVSGSKTHENVKIDFTIEGVTDKTKVRFITTGNGIDPVIAGLAIEGTEENPIPSDSQIQTRFKITPSTATKFNDTDANGYGEFEGWGTSLCWWANRLGYSEKLTSDAARVFFSDEGLDLNIGRYNVGGGDLVGEVKEDDYTVPANENADVYDLETEGKKPSYSGSNMKLQTVDFSGATYKFSDADFGFTQGKKSQKFNYIGWINGIGDSVGSGDNLHFTVNADKEGTYTIKALVTLTGTNKRNIAAKVNDGEVYVCSATDINNNLIAKSGNNMLCVATIKNVKLNKGANKVDIGGQGDWTLDFIKMLVIESGKEGLVPEKEQSFVHAAHIQRSDSEVPGYCVDVTKMDLSKHDLTYYQDNFARADETSGYAWNYDWNADNRQVAILEAAAAASGEDFIAEAFSNSPPYFMTVSGCSSGNTDANKDNLRADCVTAFACYMADVIEHINNKDNGVKFQSTTAMNEPYTNYWGANSNKQEGCHFDIGESQSRIIVALNEELKNKGIDIIISGTDETSIDTAITAYNALSDDAKNVITRIDTHTYSGSKRDELSQLAAANNENLWMSEVDGSFTGGTNAGEMSAALGLASRIITDIKGLDSTAWILWNAVDMNVDANNKWDKNSLEELGVDLNGGYWGIAIGDHNNQEIVLTKKYYGYGQFTRYIRPGMSIIGSTGNSIAAYDPENQKVIIVALNGASTDKVAKFGLTEFDSIGTSVQAIRTSGSVADGENWADVSNSCGLAVECANKNFYATLKANSITTFILDASYTGPVLNGASGSTGGSTGTTDSITNYTEIPLDESMITGSTPWNNGSDTVAKLVDDNLSTFFDGLIDGYAIIDLQKTYSIKAIQYAPRAGYKDRMRGGLFYGSNDGKKWTVLYEVPNTPAENVYSTAFAKDFEVSKTDYRYIKYTAAEGENANIAEIKIFASEVQKEVITYNSISGAAGAKYLDTNGNLIQAHGGQIQQLTVDGVTKWYWVGEDKTNDYNPCDGIHMYSSTDLYNWDDEGLVLKTMYAESDFDTDYFASLYGKRAEDGTLSDYQKSIYVDLWAGTSEGGCVIERPKMLYNEKTGKYVLYFHADGKSPYATGESSNYGKAKLGIAVSDTVNGPYKLLGTYLMHQDTGYNKNWDAENGHVRDMNVFQDDDGTAYVIYSSDGNQNMYIARLNDEYTGLTYSGENGEAVEGIDYTVNFVGASREAPAMFKRGDKYYMITSGCTGWSPNPAKYAVSDSVLGPWTLLDNPCVDDGKATTYDTQSTCVVKLGEGKYMYMGDRWANPDEGLKLRNSRYVWLPIEFTSNGKIKIEKRSNWDLSVFDTIKAFDIVTELPTKATSVAELYASLPSTLEIKYEGETETTELSVEWTKTVSDYAIGDITVKGTLSTGKEVEFTVRVINDKLIYLFDCGSTQQDIEADNSLYNEFKEALKRQVKNEATDQAYTAENGAGYTGSLTSDIGVKAASKDIYGHGFWARSNKTIDYRFDLAAGDYAVDLGFAEWWNTSRGTKITVKSENGEIASKTFTLASDATDEQQAVEFTLAEATSVVVSVSKTGNPDPVLSFIAVMKKDYTHPEKAAVEENRVEATCTEDGHYDSVVYCADCDKELSRIAVTIPAKGHTSTSTVKKATREKNGLITKTCSVCGDSLGTETIYRVSTISLETNTFVKDGNAHKPVVVVKDSKGKKLTEGVDYTVTFSGEGVKAGTYTAKVVLKGNYEGNATLVYYVTTPAVKTVIETVQTVAKTVNKIISSIFKRR